MELWFGMRSADDHLEQDNVVTISPKKRPASDAGDEGDDVAAEAKKQRQQGPEPHGDLCLLAQGKGPSQAHDRFWFLSMQVFNKSVVRYYITWREPLLQDKYVFVDLLPAPLSLFDPIHRGKMMRIALNYATKVGRRLHNEVVVKLLGLLEDGKDIFPKAYRNLKLASDINPTTSANAKPDEGDGGDGAGDGNGKDSGEDSSEGRAKGNQRDGQTAGSKDTQEASGPSQGEGTAAMECAGDQVGGEKKKTSEQASTRKRSAAEMQAPIHLEVDLSQVLQKSDSCPSDGLVRPTQRSLASTTGIDTGNVTVCDVGDAGCHARSSGGCQSGWELLHVTGTVPQREPHPITSWCAFNSTLS
jgi:hypothetical protein